MYNDQATLLRWHTHSAWTNFGESPIYYACGIDCLAGHLQYIRVGSPTKTKRLSNQSLRLKSIVAITADL